MSKKTVLLVDDDERNIFAITAALMSYNLNILVAHDGAECLEKLDQNESIGLILLDMMMPVMDGFEALAHIRKNEKTKHIPVISLTALAMKGDKQKCLDAGANDYCSKPIQLKELVSLMKKYLELPLL